MSNFINKNFYKEKCVKVIIVNEDKRLTTKWLIPVNDVVTVDNRAYKLTPEKTFLSNTATFPFGSYVTPTILVNTRDAEPLDILDRDRDPIYSADDFGTAIDSNVARQIFEASQKKLPDQLLIVLLIGVLGLVGYMLFKVNDMMNIIKAIQETINSTGGVV